MRPYRNDPALSNRGALHQMSDQPKKIRSQPDQHPLIAEMVTLAEKQGMGTYSGRNFAVLTSEHGQRIEVRVDERGRDVREETPPP